MDRLSEGMVEFLFRIELDAMWRELDTILDQTGRAR